MRKCVRFPARGLLAALALGALASGAALAQESPNLIRRPGPAADPDALAGADADD